MAQKLADPRLDQPAWEAWPDDQAPPQPLPAVLLSAFGCELPPKVRRQLRSPRKRDAGFKTLWIHLDYLSAEPWVGRYHGLDSIKPDGVVQRFVFPGFGPDTGGLPGDPPRLIHQENDRQPSGHDQQVIQDQPQEPDRLQARSIQESGFESPRIFVYVYEHAPLGPWLEALSWQAKVLMPEHLAQGPLGDALRFLHSIQIEVLPPCTQLAWDRNMLACDLLLIRGEDSLVQAMRSGKPWLWQPYPQAIDTVQTKLEALIDRMSKVLKHRKGWSWWRDALHAWGLGQPPPRASLALLGRYRADWKVVAQDWADHCNALPRLDRTLCHMIDKHFGCSTA